MKKLAIATAVATAAMITTGAHAVTSNINPATGIQLYLNNFDVEWTCPGIGGATGPSAPYVTNLSIGGTATNPSLTGQVCLDVGVKVALTFNLTGTAAADGTLFDGGNVLIDVDPTGVGTAFVYYGAVTATTTNPIPCLVNMDGHLGVTAGVRANTTHGLQIPPTGVTSPLPGLWDNPLVDTGVNDAACVTNLFGQAAGLYLKGDITN